MHTFPLQGSTPSLDAASVSIPYSLNGEAATERIDVPMRAFAGGYYTNLLAMYKYLEIPFRQQRFLFTFCTTTYTEPTVKGGSLKQGGFSRIRTGDETPYFIHSSNNHRFPPLKPDGRAFFDYLSEVIYLWFVYTYFTFCCFWFPPEIRTFIRPSVPGSPSKPSGKTETLREYLKRIHLPNYFVRSYLLPLISSVTTCPHETLLNFPAADITGYKQYMHKQPHYVVEGGVRQIQQKLLEGIKIGTGRKVLKLEKIPGRTKGGRHLSVKWEEAGVVSEKYFDHVVMAVNPYVVGKIYPRLRKQMAKIPCCEAEVVLHYDERVIEPGFNHPQTSPSISKGFTEKQPTTQYPSTRLNQLLRHRVKKMLADSNAQIIHLRTTTHPSSMVFHKSLTPWTLLGTSASSSSVVTESTHIHPPGVLLTTSSIFPISEETVVEANRFVRVLRTPESRDVVEVLFRGEHVSLRKAYQDDIGASEKEASNEEEEWKNGNDGVWLVGGWCWDGMVLLEGCVRSAVRVSKELGVEVPWRVDNSWGEE